MSTPDEGYDEPREPIAWSTYHIHGTDDAAEMHWATNDDEDTGYPGVHAQDTYRFQRNERGTAIQQAVRQAGGGSRQGVGHKVSVFINGEEYKGGKDYQPTPPPKTSVPLASAEIDKDAYSGSPAIRFMVRDMIGNAHGQLVSLEVAMKLHEELGRAIQEAQRQQRESGE
ncbi:hypothetical protein [Nonomuraea sp. SYSU D8015]|uniref:hypothetical protein n=1 Tax=Nonomuraea sp. SYSU D8015 TaxID=2593644 RepID=UPI00166132A7|nr:hypothetical protein [Nonomuraea sp. SYSU D8015]